MSTETATHLNTQTLIGYTDKRGTAWHYRANLQGTESNHYPTAVPVDDVTRRLFHWTPVTGPVQTTIDGHVQGVEFLPEREGDPVAALRRLLTDNREGERRQRLVEGEAALQLVDDGQHAAGRVGPGQALDDPRLQQAAQDRSRWRDAAGGPAGLLKGGAVAWVQFELEDTIGVQGVEFRPFLTAATSLDGSVATTYQTGAQVVVCDNTLHAAMNEDATRIKVRHSSLSLSRIDSVRDALGIMFDTADVFAAEVQALTEQSVSDAHWQRFLDAWTGRRDESGPKRALTIANRTAAELDALWRNDERVAPWAGTAWGAVAATNTHMHHMQTVRNVDRVTRNTERMILHMPQIEEHEARTLKVLARTA